MAETSSRGWFRGARSRVVGTRPSSRAVRNALCAQVESLGYQQLGRRGAEDVFGHARSGHQVVLVPYPGWRRRVDIVTMLSAFPLPSGQSATVFELDLGSQIGAGTATAPGRWCGTRLAALVEAHLLPYLRAASCPGAVLDMMLDGEVRPVGSGGAEHVVQHGYYIAKWWRLADRVPALRSVAAEIPPAARATIEWAPWGRTELAEVMWHGRELPDPPNRAPWGLSDQGDPRFDSWFHDAAAATREAALSPLPTHSTFAGSPAALANNR